jgi:hypothetical protein
MARRDRPRVARAQAWAHCVLSHSYPPRNGAPRCSSPCRPTRNFCPPPISPRRSRQIVLHCAHRATTIYLIAPSKLVCFSLLEGHSCWSTCGRRTRPFSGRAFREHRTNVGALPILSYRARSASRRAATRLSSTRTWMMPYFEVIHPSSLIFFSRGWGLNDLPLRVAFSPAHSMARRDVPLALARAFQFDKSRLRKWPRLPFTARIERAHSYRARSASKKGTWPLPPHPSEAARCASTEDHQAPSPSPVDSLSAPLLDFSSNSKSLKDPSFF